MLRASTAAKMGLQPVARIVSQAVHAQAPEWFSTAPAGAIEKALNKAGWSAGHVDLWEENEAFAAALRRLRPRQAGRLQLQAAEVLPVMRCAADVAGGRHLVDHVIPQPGRSQKTLVDSA
jgi:hypothetical protein